MGSCQSQGSSLLARRDGGVGVEFHAHLFFIIFSRISVHFSLAWLGQIDASSYLSPWFCLWCSYWSPDSSPTFLPLYKTSWSRWRYKKKSNIVAFAVVLFCANAFSVISPLHLPALVRVKESTTMEGKGFSLMWVGYIEWMIKIPFCLVENELFDKHFFYK